MTPFGRPRAPSRTAAFARSSFPDPNQASADGLIAYGGDVGPERLIDAYSHGIFPWFNDDDEPVLWWSPDPRTVIAPSDLHISRSLAKRLRSDRFRVTVDEAFADVTAACAEPRKTSTGTWITPRMRAGYQALHEMGLAHSVETWSGGELAGGLYGVSLGRMFFGESMFARVPDASKVALAHLAHQLEAWDYTLIDCQLPNEHLATLGAREIPRRDFLALVRANTAKATRQGHWTFDPVANACPKWLNARARHARV